MERHLINGNARRARYAAENGFDLLYAENTRDGYDTVTYSDGARVPVRRFASLGGLQSWAEQHHYAIIYVN